MKGWSSRVLHAACTLHWPCVCCIQCMQPVQPHVQHPLAFRFIVHTAYRNSTRCVLDPALHAAWTHNCMRHMELQSMGCMWQVRLIPYAACSVGSSLHTMGSAGPKSPRTGVCCIWVWTQCCGCYTDGWSLSGLQIDLVMSLTPLSYSICTTSVQLIICKTSFSVHIPMQKSMLEPFILLINMLRQLLA